MHWLTPNCHLQSLGETAILHMMLSILLLELLLNTGKVFTVSGPAVFQAVFGLSELQPLRFPAAMQVSTCHTVPLANFKKQ